MTAKKTEAPRKKAASKKAPRKKAVGQKPPRSRPPAPGPGKNLSHCNTPEQAAGQEGLPIMHEPNETE